MMEKIFFAVLQIGITVSAVILLLVLVRRFLKKRYPARMMCIVWAILAIRLLIPVQFTLQQAPVNIAPPVTNIAYDAQAGLPMAQNQLNLLDTTAENPIEPAQNTMQQTQASIEVAEKKGISARDVLAIMQYIWLFGMIVFLSMQAEIYLHFKKRLRQFSFDISDEKLTDVFAEEAKQLGISQGKIALKASKAADCPMLVGFFKPMLYLPHEFFNEKEAAFIFKHELTHYHQRDLWLKLALVFARAVHWFNPLVHIMAKKANEDIELACDASVSKGMSTLNRKAYGETILRSVIEQSRRSPLVSCFSGGKKEIMSRFENLFDKTVRKRGIAFVLLVCVVVGTVGCAFTVGAAKTEDEAEMIAAAKQYYEEMSSRPTPRVAAEKGDKKNTAFVIFETYTDDENILTREVDRVYMQKKNGKWTVKKDEFAGVKVDSLEDFRLYYENDLGLPDCRAREKLNGTDAASELLQLDAAIDLAEADREPRGEKYIDDVRTLMVAFQDGSKVNVTLVENIPMDWTDENGENNRTVCDLTQQFYYAIQAKQGQYLYPILSAEKQTEYVDYQKEINGAFYWKLGFSSPSYHENYEITQISETQARLTTYAYGGGWQNQKVAFDVTIGKENGRSVITDITQLETYHEEILTDTIYQNTKYGYQLVFPESMVGEVALADYYVDCELGICMNDSGDDYSGMLAILNMESETALKEAHGENWKDNLPVPCRELGKRNGMIYYLTFASDVQYDPSDTEIAEKYQQLSQAVKLVTLTFSDGEEYLLKENERFLEQTAGVFGANMADEYGDTCYAPVQQKIDGQNLTYELLLCRINEQTKLEERAIISVKFGENKSMTPIQRAMMRDFGIENTTLDAFDQVYPMKEGALTEYPAKNIPLLQSENKEMQNPLTAAEEMLSLAGGTWNSTDYNEQAEYVEATYRFRDKTELTLTMQKVWIDPALAPIYLVTRYRSEKGEQNVETQGKTDYNVYRLNYAEYFPAYTMQQLFDLCEKYGTYDSVLEEFDRRYETDKAIESEVKAYSETIYATWQRFDAQKAIERYAAFFQDGDYDSMKQMATGEALEWLQKGETTFNGMKQLDWVGFQNIDDAVAQNLAESFSADAAQVFLIEFGGLADEKAIFYPETTYSMFAAVIKQNDTWKIASFFTG